MTSNEPPPTQLTAIQKAASHIVPRDAAGKPSADGVIVLPVVKGDNAHQMQRVGVVRLLSQGLPGTAFGFGDLSHLQKAETEFAERSRRGRVRRACGEPIRPT